MEFSEEIRYGSIDRADWYFETALKAYCKSEKKSESELNENDYDNIYLYAGNHIGFFLTWIIKNNFTGEIHDDETVLEKVKNDEMSGTEFLMSECDGKFWGEDVSDEIFPFVHYYYTGEEYLSDYQNWVINELCDLPCEFIGTYEDYYRFEHIINEKWENFRNNTLEKS